MSDNDRNEAREAAARAFTGLCCVTVADEVCEDCVGALLYLASMHEAIEYLHLRDFAQQNTIRNLRRRLSRHEAHEDVVERMRVTARDAAEKLGLSRGPKTRAEVMRERDPLLDTSLPELFDAECPKHASAEATWAAIAGRAIGAYAVAQAERDHLRRALIRVPTTHLPACPIQALADTKPVEGDFCRECQYRPEKLEHTSADCWLVWQEAVRTALAATEEGSDAE